MKKNIGKSIRTRFPEKDTVERADRFFGCDEMHQRKPVSILEERSTAKRTVS